MGKTRPEITQQKAAWAKEWARIATPKMMEALALLDALPDPQFTLVLERCLDRLRVIDRRLEDELEAAPRLAVAPAPPRPGARLPLYGRTRSEASSRRFASDNSLLCAPWPR